MIFCRPRLFLSKTLEFCHRLNPHNPRPPRPRTWSLFAFDSRSLSFFHPCASQHASVYKQAKRAAPHGHSSSILYIESTLRISPPTSSNLIRNKSSLKRIMSSNRFIFLQWLYQHAYLPGKLQHRDWNRCNIRCIWDTRVCLHQLANVVFSFHESLNDIRFQEFHFQL